MKGGIAGDSFLAGGECMIATAAPTFVLPQPNDFWATVGIFPDALKQRDEAEVRERQVRDEAEVRERQVRKTLQKLGRGNLRLLCEEACIPRSPDAGSEELAGLLLSATPEHTLLHLREFMRGRIEVIEHVYESAFSAAQRTRFEAAIHQLSHEGEQIKVFTKLCLLYRQSEKRLLDVYFLKLWRSRPTAYEYKANRRLPGDIATQVSGAAPDLQRTIRKANSNRDVRLLGCHTLSDGTVVVVLLRQYVPTIKRDFARQYNLHFDCGYVVLSVHPKESRIDVRCGTERVAEALRDWFATKFQVKLSPLRNQVFSDYDPESVTAALLGGYSPEHGVEITEARFRRSNLPSHSALALEATLHQMSIREDLAALRENGTLSPRTLADLEGLTLSFDKHLARVTVEHLFGGALRFSFDNAGWEPTLARNFGEAFQKAFGIPLDRMIDPTKLAMGELGVIGYLLMLKTEDEVQVYQRKTFERLLKDGVLLRKPQTVKVCRSARCELFDDRRQNKGRAECRSCGTRLHTRTDNFLHRNPSECRQIVDKALQPLGWALGGKEKQFEGLQYFPLRPSGAPGQSGVVAVLFRDALPDSLRYKYERTSRPLLLVRSRCPDRQVYLDENGVGHVSLAFLLSSVDTPSAKDCERQCKQVLDSLIADKARRVAQSGHRSYENILNRLGQLTDKEFETDVFHVLRSLFPETIKLGRTGKTEPDGFSAFPLFEGWDLGDGKLWTWTYDAKLAEGPGEYNFDSDEYRKVLHYVKKFRRVNSLFSKSKRLMAHVLISNKIAEGRMKVAADFFYGPDGLKKEDHEVSLVLMPHTFLLQLYKRVRAAEEEIRRREPFLAKELAKMMSTRKADGYVLLSPDHADRLVESVLGCDPVYPEIKEDLFVQSIDAASE